MDRKLILAFQNCEHKSVTVKSLWFGLLRNKMTIAICNVVAYVKYTSRLPYPKDIKVASRLILPV